MFKVFNDVHADPDLMKRIASLKVNPGDILVANGDFLGSRGPITNEIVKIFYEVKRGETTKYELQRIFSTVLGKTVFIEESLITKAIHSGTFLAEMCRRHSKFKVIVEDEVRQNLVDLDRISGKVRAQGGTLIYLPGNCEITISDFDVRNGVNGEKVLPPKERFFNQLAAENAFSSHGTEYVNQPRLIGESTLLVPIDFIDEWVEGAKTLSQVESITSLIVHYPPYSPNVISCFNKLFGYEPNIMDNLRMYAVSEIIDELPNLELIVFGHIHPGISQEAIEKLPTSVIFREKGCRLVWNCPGNVFAFN